VTEKKTIFIRKKLVASTLIEVIIAMSILMTVFGIAMLIFLNLESYNGNRERIRAQVLMQSILQKNIASHEYEDSESEWGHLHIEQTVTVQNDSGTLLLIEQEARNKKNGLLVLRQETVVKIPIYEVQ